MNIACSGATAGDLFTVQGVSGPNIPAQLTTAFANGTPQLMTITAGANDIHWAAFLKKCAASTCGTASDSSIANIYMTVLKFKLHYALSSIQARSHGTPPTVVMTGYYNPVSAACNSIDARFTPSELAWFSGEVAALNQTIQNVSSQYSFARFAPVDFTGHDLCSADSWVQGLQDPAPIHPTAAGQAAIANAVLTKL
jgi:lysophospholipase L1-like esterase